MKKIFIFGMFALVASQAWCQNKVENHEIELVAKNDWKGSYTVLDFPTGKHRSIPVELKAERTGDRSVEMKFIYPFETKNNKSTDKLKFGKDLTSIEGKPIILKDLTDDGQIRFVTMDKEKYNGQKAEVYYSYIVGPNKFEIKKEVQFEGSQKLILAEGYEFIRNQY
jgi:hypothetical protein